GNDYMAIAQTTLTFGVGETVKLISVAIVGDTSDEPNETFTVNLTAPGHATIDPAHAQATGTIIDDDVPTISIGNASVSEGNTGTTSAVFTVSLTSPCSPTCPATV